MMCLRVGLFASILFGTLCAFWTYMSISFTKLGKLYFIIFSNRFQFSCSFSSPSGTPMMWMLVCLKLSQRLLTLFSFFFWICCSEWLFFSYLCSKSLIWFSDMVPTCWFCGLWEEGSEKGQWPLPAFMSERKLSPSSCLDARHLSSFLPVCHWCPSSCYPSAGAQRGWVWVSSCVGSLRGTFWDSRGFFYWLNLCWFL